MPEDNTSGEKTSPDEPRRPHRHRHHRLRSHSSHSSRPHSYRSESGEDPDLKLAAQPEPDGRIALSTSLIQDEGIPITAPAFAGETSCREDSDSKSRRHRHSRHHHHHSSSREGGSSEYREHLSHRTRTQGESQGPHPFSADNETPRKRSSSSTSARTNGNSDAPAPGSGLRQRLASFSSWFSRLSKADGATVSRREKMIGALAVGALVTPAVLYSAVRPETQLGSLGFSAAAFLFLFLPVFDRGKSRTALDAAKALVRFPLFWLGLLLFALMACQGLNTEWSVVVRTYTMRLFPETDYIRWLPAGVDSPFDMDRSPGGMNAFRQMIIFGGPWLLLCALWAGVRRRKAIVGIAWGVLIAGFALAAYGVEMRITGQQNLGPHNMLNSSFFATFLYQNHAGAWLSLLFGSALALTFWHWGKTATVKASGGPHLLSAGLALCLVCASVCTLSFGGMFTLGTLLFVGAPIGVLWTLFRKGISLNSLVGGAVASALLAMLAFVFFETTDLHETEAKLSRKFNLAQTAQIDDREPFREATWKMVEYKDYQKLLSGWGAGSYRWVSPHFYKRVKAFQPRDGSRDIHKYGRANYAHCDWLQMLVEWGIAGVAIVLAAFLWMAAWLLVRIRRWSPATFVLVFALVLFIGHASADFLNYSMPVLSLVAFTAIAAARFVLPASKTAAKLY